MNKDENGRAPAGCAMVRRAIQLFVAPGSVLELRVPRTPHRGTVSGYFDNIDLLAQSAARMSGEAEGVYITLNPVNRQLLARASNRLVDFAGHTTSDRDVVRRHWFLLDFDPVRPAGISSTDSEHESALERAKECRDWLRGRGWPEPVLADSGNGAHLDYRVDLPNDDHGAKLLKSCLTAIGMQFSESTVEVDLTTYNAARIIKVYGTLAAKGDCIPERPHRLARLLDVPDVLVPVTLPSLEALARCAPKPESSQGKSTTANLFDLQRWIADHQLKAKGPSPWQDGRRWELEVCPWNPEHRGSAFIVQFANGAIGAGCLHKACRDKDWQSLRELVEPGWRNHAARYRHGFPAEANLPFQTAAQFSAQTPKAVEWIVPPWVAKAAITQIEGKIKAAGKTTFVAHMVKAVLDGSPFMGKPTIKSSVVYLTEQPRASFRQALSKAHLLEHTDLILLFWHDVMKLPWAGVARAAIDECKQKNAKLLVVDTGPQWAKLVGDSENNAGDMLAALEPLQEAVAAGIAVILVWHERKGGGDVSDAGRGSSSGGGAVDIILLLRRRGGKSRRTTRSIKALSRFDETPEDLVVDLTPDGYVALGQPSEAEALEAQESILAVAPHTEEDAKSVEALSAAANLKSTTGRRIINALCQSGKLVRLGGGRKGDPHRFWGPQPSKAQKSDLEKESRELVSEEL